MKFKFTETNRDPSGPLRIDDITVLWVDDDDPKLAQDTLGTYSDAPGPHAIDRATLPGYSEHELQYWHPAIPDPEHPENALQDYARHEALGRGEWGYQGCVARAVVSYPVNSGNRRMEYLSSGGLFGIESDSSPLYRMEVEIEQIEDLKEHVQKFSIPWSDEWEAKLQSLQATLKEQQELARISAGE